MYIHALTVYILHIIHVTSFDHIFLLLLYIEYTDIYSKREHHIVIKKNLYNQEHADSKIKKKKRNSKETRLVLFFFLKKNL